MTSNALRRSFLLTIIFAFALAVHSLAAQLDLLVFVAGVLLVRIHGSAYDR